MDLASSNIKKFLIFQETESRKKFLIFREMELSDSKIKKLRIVSQKKSFLKFLEMEPCTF